MADRKIPDVDLSGKTVIVTGANAGIGKETARELLRLGARVILACRDRSRGEAALQDIIQDTGKDTAVLKILDLGSLASVKEFADDINKTEDRLDILVNNAGVFTRERHQTADGIELMFGVNYLGHFYLTNLLMDKLKLSAPSRIVNVSSTAHTYRKLNRSDINDLHNPTKFEKVTAYSNSKTANILHTVELASKLEGSGVTAYAVHPGYVRTGILREFGDSWLMWLGFRIICFWNWLLGLNMVLESREGALTTLYCCLQANIAEHSGRYYDNCKETTAAQYATDPDSAKKLWEMSNELITSIISRSLVTSSN